MVVDQIQPGPVRCFFMGQPNNSPLLLFFSSQFGMASWAKPNIWPTLFPVSLLLFMRWVPLVSFIYASDPFVRFLCIGPTRQKVKFYCNTSICGSHWSGFHFTGLRITYKIHISNRRVTRPDNTYNIYNLLQPRYAYYYNT